MGAIPEFDHRGLLPPGDYEATFDELKGSVLVHGPEQNPVEGWDSAWRLHLVKRSEVLVGQLWAIGITEVYLDGSFVEAKAHPNDIDGYFVCDLFEFARGEVHNKLNALDPHSVWTWDPASRKAYRGYTKKQLPMWHVYRVELYPHFGQSSGIQDRHGNEMMFPAAFRCQRFTDEPKGIIKVVQSK